MSRAPLPTEADGPAVRRLRAAEWELYREVRLRALASDPLAFGSTVSREAALDESEWRARTERAATGVDAATFVAELPGSRFAGLVSVVRVDGTWHVFSMWLEPSWRGRGVGAQLLDVALAWHRETAPNAALVLDVNPRQEAAVRLYERRGFRRTGGLEPLGHTPGETLVTMVLDPAPATR